MPLKLVKIQEQDLPSIIKWRMKPEITKYMYTDPVLTLENQKKWFEKIKTDEKSKYWMIQIDGTNIGVLSINNIDIVNKRCEWAYYIGDDSFKGRGIASILECNIYDYVFETLNLNKLCCEVFVFNQKVIAIHKKFGTKIEGTLRQHIYKNRQYYDIVLMAIIREDWNKLKNGFSYEKIRIE